MTWTNRFGKFFGVAATTGVIALAGGCLTRPVGQQPPTTKVNFTSQVTQAAVDKVDLLFAIDNSASMGDKQLILKDAVPDLIQGLLTPKCVDENTGDAVTPASVADPVAGNKTNRFGCPTGTKPEFEPVIDMHIGIVDSSLGTFGAGFNNVGGTDICGDDAAKNNNDHAHLLTRRSATDGGGDVPAAKPSSFLAWFPDNEANKDATRHPIPTTPTRTIADLTAAFQQLVVGTQQNGCGLEAQLESMYHFLIQPDPWLAIEVDSKLKAVEKDIDVELLQQRADFLRPDSLVAIIMLTDEDDSSSDPLAANGQGWAYMARNFPSSKVVRPNGTANTVGTTAPRGTSICRSKGPGDADCTSCGFTNLAVVKNDPDCQKLGSPAQGGDTTGYAGYYGPDEDSMNVRFHRMKERFGVDPQYPIKRYVDGLRNIRIPDRSAEHVETVDGSGSRSIAAYSSTPKCTNPLFAAALPRAAGDDLCNLKQSTRTSDLIFFAVVGGVPNSLLHFKANDPEASRITDTDWVKILGQDPVNFDYTGIDPHMIQSVVPRAGIAAGPSATRGDNGTDPVHGREWDTKNEDLQFACTFPLPTPRTNCTDTTQCDCADANTNPPLCGPANNTQVRAKAYPTVREFEVVHALGDQGVIASLCPIQLTDKNAPDYGYRPAVAAIVDRLKNALTVQCLPQQLTRDATTNEVPCLVLAQLGAETDSCAQYADRGLSEVPEDIKKTFLEQQRAASGTVTASGTDLSRLPVCVVQQKGVARGDTCANDGAIEWCYAENDTANHKTAAGRCAQAILFSTGAGQLQGAKFSLQCIQQFSAGQAAGDTTK